MEATAVQTVAFDGKCNNKRALYRRCSNSFWAHRLGTLLGTLGAFFARSVEKMEGKRRKAAVLLTVALDVKYSPRLRRKELANRAGDSPRR